MTALEVLDPGILTLVQDIGRFGHADVGVGRSGAADGSAYRLGARLVAHPVGLAALEALLGGLTVRAHGSVLVAVTGAAGPLELDGHEVGRSAPVWLSDGQELRIGTPAAGLRSYLTVRGGVAVPTVLGSRSTDTLSGLGPAPIKAGELLPVGRLPESTGQPNVDQAPVRPPATGLVTLEVTAGPRLDWLAEPGDLFDQTWTVTVHSDRVGLRLEGRPIRWHAAVEGRELPSEGMVRGCLQVPPGGQPVLFGPDHPVTGGYPVPVVVTRVDADRAAQLRPGQSVRFRWAVPPRR